MKTLCLTLAAVASGVGYSLPPVPNLAAADQLVVQDPMKPGPQHTMLMKSVGAWDAVIITHDEKGAEQKTKGTMTTKKHTEFHTVDDFQGEFMGMKMLGHGVNGYCTVKQKFFTFWTDSMTPSPMSLTGDYDATKQKLTMTGECFGMSGKLEPCRTVTHNQDDDHRTWVMFGAGPDGKEMEMLRVQYTRKK